ncbi:hydrogenase small subunit [Desulfotalea psychrophila]|uniref:Probable Ni/Fe-hydrogenase, small subunit n=1 Tax=Desulfotalea psychrophila (strain LSv54 / DSM 12343) TaxID=177439 RepID=Q6AQS0_DESPS|nr:hydrogenase small subunit [Desulfotalea psychrophila]CAG35303.1 probable Ni/Fe-hydrogenase, small subunit [Desulfotalea psychrophila LSv54]
MADTVNTTMNPKLNRRGFLKGCTMVAAALGLSDAMIPKLVEAASSGQRPRVIWLHFQECTGCTESLLRASHPDLARLILDVISLDYHETVMAAAGYQAEANLHDTVDNHPFILIVEGAIPVKDNGIYCKIGGRTALEILGEVAPKATAIIAIGTCATSGGIQAASPNPTGAVGVEDLPELTGNVPIVNIPGCPPNPVNLLGTILYYLTFKRLPALDSQKRPLFAYGRRIHDQCERRGHFDEGRFAEKFGDKFHQMGYCLYKVGCKGPETFANCPTARFNDVGVWPVSIGHGCIGCTEKNFWDTMTPFYERLPNVKIPGTGIVADADKIGKVLVGATAVGVAAHAAIGIGKRLIKGKPKEKEDKE